VNVSLPSGAAIVPVQVLVQLTVTDAAVVPFAATAIVADAVADETYCVRRVRALDAVALGTAIRKRTVALDPACGATDALGAGSVACPPPPAHAEARSAPPSIAPARTRRSRTTSPPRWSSRR
jgi:hypothetical protein